MTTAPATPPSRPPANAAPRPNVTGQMLVAAVRDMLPAALTPFLGIVAALGIIILILEWQGADPQVAWRYVYEGTLETAAKRADLVAFWMPLAITAFGLVLTFTAGLWNIGVEGQMIMGAIGGTWAIRLFAESRNPPLGLNLGHNEILVACFVFAAVLGSAWACYRRGAQNARRRQRDFRRRRAQLHRADLQHVPDLQRRSLAARGQPRHRNRPLPGKRPPARRSISTGGSARRRSTLRWEPSWSWR